MSLASASTARSTRARQGGGAGLVLRPDVAAAAIDSLPAYWRAADLSQPARCPVLAGLGAEIGPQAPGLTFFCGRFEGLDQRVIERRNMLEVSLGDFVLAGGEVAAMAMLEATLRLIPGVAGNQASVEEESFSSGLLEYPHFTLPRTWEGESTPDVLLVGQSQSCRRVEESAESGIDKNPPTRFMGCFPKWTQFASVGDGR